MEEAVAEVLQEEHDRPLTGRVEYLVGGVAGLRDVLRELLIKQHHDPRDCVGKAQSGFLGKKAPASTQGKPGLQSLGVPVLGMF
jgi:hypothetical protein